VAGREYPQKGSGWQGNGCLHMAYWEALLKILREKFGGENRGLIMALVCYLVLIVITLIVFLPVRTSNDRFILWLVLALFAILIVKTIAHSQDDSK
jgi:hypothetical protein